ncbi:uncharacterized protein LOC142335287 isoform X2 [Convolutriloba macropyga]
MISVGKPKMPETLSVASGVVFYFLVGLEETIMSSYFSLEAEKRQLNIMQTGLCLTMMDFSTFIFSFVIMFTIQPNMERFYCIWGMIIFGVAAAATGVLQWIKSGELFFAVSIGLEFFIGIGCAMSLATVIPLMTKGNLERAGKITSLAETALSFGCMSGPPLGSILYTFSGGMFMPQFSSGMLAVACGIVSISTIFSTSSSSTTISTEDSKSRFANRTKFKVPPQFNGSTNSLSATTHSQYSSFENTLISLPGQVWSIEESRSLFDHWAYFKFVTKPYLIVVSLLGILVAAQELFFEVCLSLYLHDQFAMDTVQIGCMFLAYNMPNTIMNVVYGTAVDEGYAIPVTILTAFGFSASFFALFLPHVVPSLRCAAFLAPCFSIAGLFSAGTFVPAYLTYEKIAQFYGFRNLAQIKLLVSTWLNNLFSVGALLGAIAISGPVYETLDFNLTCLVISLSMCSAAIASVIVFHKMKLLTKLYYVE